MSKLLIDLDTPAFISGTIRSIQANMDSLEPSASSRVFSIPEILSQIVEHTLFKPDFKDLYGASFNDVMTEVKTAWLVLLVCKHWRNIVLSTPALWSHIVLCHNDEDDLNDAVLLSMLDTYLERSRNTPLIISMVNDLGRYSSRRESEDRWEVRRRTDKFFCGLLERLLPTQRRWRDVKLRLRWYGAGPRNIGDTHEATLPKNLMTLRLQDMKSLVSLDLEIMFQPLSDPLSVPLSKKPQSAVKVEIGPCHLLEQLAVNLESGAVLYELTHDDSRAEHYFPNLRSLKIAGSRVNWSVLLQRASNIEHLRIDDFPDSTSFGAPPSPIKLPNLKVMDLGLGDMPYVLRCFKLPPLVKLKMAFNDYCLHYDDQHLKKVMVAISNSAVELDELSIHWGTTQRRHPINSNAFQEFFGACDKLRRLRLHVVYFDHPSHTYDHGIDHSLLALLSAFRTVLRPSTNQTHFLPHLNTFELKLVVQHCETYRPENATIYMKSIRSLVSAMRRKYTSFFFKLNVQLIENSHKRFKDWNYWRNKLEEDLCANTAEVRSSAEVDGDDDFKFESAVELVGAKELLLQIHNPHRK